MFVIPINSTTGFNTGACVFLWMASLLMDVRSRKQGTHLVVTGYEF